MRSIQRWLTKVDANEAGAREIWRFSTRAVNCKQRNAVWSDAMRRLKLPFAPDSPSVPVDGRISVVATPMGVQLARIEASPLIIEGKEADQGPGLWLLLISEGEAEFKSKDLCAAIRPGRVLFGVTRHDSKLELKTSCRMIFIRIPTLVIGRRMLAPLRNNTGLFKGENSLERILISLLQEIYNELEKFTKDELAAIETSLVDIIVTALATSGGGRSKGGAMGARAAHFDRICQMLESLLGEPELTLDRVARETGVSPRYLQKIFSQENYSFSMYVRERRLERCFADLISPLYSQQSITQVAFRWGFSSSAHFSRTFRERFGVSPRQHRQKLGVKSASSIKELGLNYQDGV